MNSAEYSNRASALTKHLRAELRDTRFSVTHLAHGHIEFVPGDHGSSTRSTLEETSNEELDARGLKTLHQGAAWKRAIFRSAIRVKALRRGSESAARLDEFERLLDDIGILFESHVAHALGNLLPGYRHSTVQTDAPEKSTGVSTTADLWSYLLVDACLTTPRRTANKVLGWACGTHSPSKPASSSAG